jgi:hypothetical protein
MFAATLSRRAFLGSLWAIPTTLTAIGNAHAEENAEYYAAIAYSRKTGRYGTAWGYRSQGDAEASARQYCNAADAEAVMWTRDGWCALATGSGGWGAGWDAQPGKAIDSAIASCRRFSRDARVVALVYAKPKPGINYEWGEIPDDFGRRQILREAMNILHDRFRDPLIAQNVYDVLRGGAWIHPGVLEKHGFGTDESSINNLLWRQIVTLREAEQNGAMWFPKVVLRAPQFDANDRSWARGSLGVVTARSRSDVTGAFDVQINLRRLGGGGDQSNPLQWAAMIAHEMLHNLGHKHPETGRPEVDYSDNYQINVFTRAVYCGGSYKKGQVIPGFV